MREGRDGRRVPRVYDRESGEYRPVPRGTAPTSAAAVRAGNRRRRRRRALALFYILLFLAVVSGAAAVSLTVLFKIESVGVSGSSRYSQSQIAAASGIKKGDNLFLADTRKAEEQIRSRLPYIGTVKVRRRFPAEISIEVASASVCGAVPYGKSYAVLGTDFRVLELPDKPPQGCPVIEGVALKSAKTGAAAGFSDATLSNSLREVTAALQKNGLKNITGMDFSSPSRVLLDYEDRVTINLGMPSDLDYKIRYAKALFDSGKISQTDRGTLNLSTTADNDTAYFDPSASSG